MPRVNKRKINKLEQKNILDTNLQNKIKKERIILRKVKNYSWIWNGESEKKQFSLEEPLVLNLDNQDYYFYSNGIEIKNHHTSNKGKWYSRLDYSQQEKVLKAFAKQTDNKYWNFWTLLKMKINFLTTLANFLSEYLDKNSNLSLDEAINLKDKFISEYQSSYSLIKEHSNSELVNQTIMIFKGSYIFKLKGEINNLYENLEYITDKFKAKQIDFLIKPSRYQYFLAINNLEEIFQTNELLEKQIEDQNLFFNTEEKNKINSKIILLRNFNHKSWIWRGIDKKDQFSLEEPVILDFDDKKFYFYSNGIEAKNYRYKNNFYQKYSKLDYFRQEQLLNGFDKQNNHKYWDKWTLLQLKIDFLDTMANVLSENLDEKVSLSASEFYSLKDKFLSEYENFYSLINEKDDSELTKTSVPLFVISFKNKKRNVYYKFEKLVEKFKNKDTDILGVTVNKTDQKNELNKEDLVINPKQNEKPHFKVILLRIIETHSWIWKGISEKDYSSFEEPVILNLDDKKFYFYSNGIDRKNYRYSHKLLKLYSKLDYFQQEQLLNVFAKQSNNKYCDKLTLLKIKGDFLNNMVDVLSESLHEKSNFCTSEFKAIKNKFESEYESFCSLINEENDSELPEGSLNYKVKFLSSFKNKRGKLYEKIEKLIKKFKEKNIDFLLSNIDENEKRNQLLSNISQPNNYDSLIDNMITDNKYEEYLDNNFLLDLEKDSSTNEIDLSNIPSSEKSDKKIWDLDNKNFKEEPFNNKKLLKNITESDAYDSLINNMITDNKYEKYLDNNFLFDLEKDSSINLINHLQEFDSPALKKLKLNNSEAKKLLKDTTENDLSNITPSENNDKMIWDLDNKNFIKEPFSNNKKFNYDLDILTLLKNDSTVKPVNSLMSYEDLLDAERLLNLSVEQEFEKNEFEL